MELWRLKAKKTSLLKVSGQRLKLYFNREKIDKLMVVVLLDLMSSGSVTQH